LAIDWVDYRYRTGRVTRFCSNECPTITPSPELKQELESSGDPPEAQKIDAESQQLQLQLQLQIQGQPTPAVKLGILPLNDPTLLKLEQGEAGPDPDPADAF
jgi:hypothetical protein